MGIRRACARNLLLTSAAMYLAFSTIDSASSQEPVDTNLQIGSKAAPIDRTPPKYPRGAELRGQEGWVLVSYVIGTDGKVSNVILTDSSIKKVFDKAAMSAVEKWTFEPAVWNGQLTEQCSNSILITFEVDYGQSDRGARSSFIRKFKKASKLAEKNQLQEALEAIEALRDKEGLKSLRDRPPLNTGSLRGNETEKAS